MGTRFSVDLAGVRTERGTVRVLSPDGKLFGYLEGGHSLDAAPTAPPHAEAAGAARAAHRGAGAAQRRRRRWRPPPRAGDAGGRGAALAWAGRGARSRAATPARRGASSSRCSGWAATSPPRRAPSTRSRILIEGRYADASRRLQIVVRDFPTTPQAESALYAVAQLESEHGRPAEARATLQRYLARYPHGRFAKEAADRLARLSPPQPR